MGILEGNLISKFGTKPVHSIKEIELLKSRFTENIRFYFAERIETIVGSKVLFIMKNIVHVQYK